MATEMASVEKSVAVMSSPHEVVRRRRVKRVAFVTSRLGRGGGERVVTHLMTGLAEWGVEPMAVCMKNEGLFGAQLKDRHLRVEALNSFAGYDFQAIRRLADLLRGFRPCVINIHDRGSLPYAVLANLVSGRRPVVFTGHGLVYNAAREPVLRQRLAMRGVTAMTAVSQKVADRHAELFLWPKPIHVIPNGVPEVTRCSRLRQAVRNELELPDTRFVFLAIGNVKPEKDYENLLRAVGRVRTICPRQSFEVLIAGHIRDSPYVQQVIALHRDLRLEQTVRFLGFREDVRALYSAADAFVLPSRSEGCPMVLLEAMMCGLPVIATRVGGIPDVLQDGSGLLVPTESPWELGSAMARVMQEADFRAALGRKDRSRAQEAYGVDRMVRDYLDLFGILAQPSRRATT